MAATDTTDPALRPEFHSDTARRAAAAIDVATVIARLVQIDREQRPQHWLWDRVMTCDVPRLLQAVDHLDADLRAQLRDVVDEATS